MTTCLRLRISVLSNTPKGRIQVAEAQIHFFGSFVGFWHNYILACFENHITIALQ